jgi:hypothetical protein
MSKNSTKVINVRKVHLNKRGIADFKEWKAKPDSVYIGRNMNFYVPGALASKWANPFTVKKYGLEVALAKYEEKIRNSPELMADLESLIGKELGCWCRPEPCHGDVLLKLIGELEASMVSIKKKQ